MPKGVFTLSKVRRKKILNEWEDPNNVWVFPDGGGAEFKFIDGTVTPAPPATPLGPTKKYYNLNQYDIILSKEEPASEQIGLSIAVNDADKKLVMTTRNGIRVYDTSNLNFVDSNYVGQTIDIDLSTGYTNIPLPTQSATEYYSTGNSSALYQTDTGWEDGDSAQSYGNFTWNTMKLDHNHWGSAVAVGNGKIVVGSPGHWQNWIDKDTDEYVVGGHVFPKDIADNSTPGKVYVCDYDGSNAFVIEPSNNERGWKFGYSVAIGNNKIAIGAPRWRGSNGTSYVPGGSTAPDKKGAVFIYNLDGTGEVVVQSGATDHSEFFGTSVKISNNRLYVGAPGANYDSTIKNTTGQHEAFSGGAIELSLGNWSSSSSGTQGHGRIYRVNLDGSNITDYDPNTSIHGLGYSISATPSAIHTGFSGGNAGHGGALTLQDNATFSNSSLATNDYYDSSTDYSMFGSQLESFEDTVNNRMNIIASPVGDVSYNVETSSRTMSESPSTWRYVSPQSHIPRDSDARIKSYSGNRAMQHGRYDTIAVDSRYFYATRNGMPNGSSSQTSTTLEPLKMQMVADLEVSSIIQPLL